MRGPVKRTNWLVHNQVLIGPHQDDSNVDKLISLGFKHFVNLIGDFNKEEYVKTQYAKNVNYLWFPISDFSVRNDDETLLVVAQIV